MQKIVLKFSDPSWDIETLEQVLEEYMEEQEENEEGPFWENGCSSYERPNVCISDVEVVDFNKVSCHYTVTGTSNDNYERGDWGSDGDDELDGVLVFELPIMQGSGDVIDCIAIEHGNLSYTFN